MKIKILLTIFFMPLYLLSSGLRIIFPENSSIVIGVSPLLINQIKMNDYSLEQAAVFSAKLDSTYSIFELAILEKDFIEFDNNDFAEFSLNVITDSLAIRRKIMHLKKVDSIIFGGHYIAFYGFIEKNIKPEYIFPLNDLVVRKPFIRIEDADYQKSVTSFAYASCSRLDEALDEAFSSALSELSKNQNIHIRNMRRSFLDFHESTTLISSRNILANVKFKEVSIFTKNENNLITYIVEVQLRKDL